MEEAAPLQRDPVCGAEVDEAEAPASLEYKGTTFYFCSRACAERFEEELGEFLEQSPPRGFAH